ncbi:hypothetical protein DFS34DRAFT_683936 [Phlyctochytrium arcticum]|nr:hypothetical protein DFS34DRAFT_683936 [Phlyctochytrium arcticum]
MSRILRHWTAITANPSRSCQSSANPQSSCRGTCRTRVLHPFGTSENRQVSSISQEQDTSAVKRKPGRPKKIKETSSETSLPSSNPKDALPIAPKNERKTSAKQDVVPTPGPISENHNQHITDILTELGRCEKNRGNPMKALAYTKSVTIISRYPKPLESGKEAQQLKGVGVKLARRIQEIIDTGTCTDLEESKNDERLQAINTLTLVSGIGTQAATKLYDQHGIRNLEDLWQDLSLLTHHQRVGREYFKEFQQMIPRDEVDVWEKLIDKAMKEVDPQMTLTIVGSHRRNAAFSGDVDALFTHPEFTSTSKSSFSSRDLLARIVDKLKGERYIIDDLSQGDVKYMGVCKLHDPNSIPRRIDIRLHPSDQYWPAVCHWTGSDNFNRWIRGVAQDQGMTLGEYGLKIKDTGKTVIFVILGGCLTYEDVGIGEVLELDSERAMFELLGVDWLDPPQRNW